MTIFIACDVEPPKEEQNIVGYWQIMQAKRNDKLTLTLEDGYIHIKSDTTLTTNILRRNLDSPYFIDGNQLVQTDPIQIEYDIINLNNDSMILNTTIRDYKFEFVLVRIDSLSN